MEEAAYLSDKSSDVAKGEVRDFVADAVDRPHVGEQRGVDTGAWERFVKWVENEAYEAIGWDAANPEAVVDAVLEEAELIDRVEGETRWGGITADEDAVREALDSGALDRAVDRRRPDIVADPDLWDDVEESVGEEFSALPSADRAMLIHAASGEPPRLGRAHPERPAAPYEPSPRVSPEQAERNREGIRKARETLRNPPADMPLPKGDQGSLMEAPDMGNMMASYENMLDSLPDRAAAALQRRQSTAVGHEATSGGNPLGNAPDWLDEVLLMIAAGGAATLLPPVGGAALLGGAAMLAQ